MEKGKKLTNEMKISKNLAAKFEAKIKAFYS